MALGYSANVLTILQKCWVNFNQKSELVDEGIGFGQIKVICYDSKVVTVRLDRHPLQNYLTNIKQTLLKASQVTFA